ncbi:MATE family efflux transporter [Weissella diestrammenae]|uniref:Probable multidrug resistance protein NorM n=1 Tax=Weissella diestrammenae TaxID=1162633 RepID=A0A7G9T730_9LACO|nr:MATE family efflux transporter [Weissella diestrammenae]MCM0582497.1 MATE family efflux transporter [Weissella diestrammenae]QNN75905.1 MATE family efflux transporter [Weissella diestrammenae]
MQDLTKGNPAKLIVLFTLPIIVGYLFQNLYNIIDTLIVGQTLGVKALAAVGSTGAIMFLSLGFVGGLTSGMSIITAQRYGAKDMQGVKRSFGQSIMAAFVVTIFLTAIGMVGLRPLLVIMQTPTPIFEMAHIFILVIWGGVITQVGYNVLANAMRAVGNSRAPLYHLILGMLINIVLELIFILVFKWGTAGAAFATVVAYGISTLTSWWHIVRYIPALHITWADLKWDRAEIRTHLSAGLPMGFQQSIIAIGSMTLQAAINSLGTDSVAGYTAASKVDQILVLVLMSFGVTMATYVAQNYGAREYQRIIDGMKRVLQMSIGSAVVLGVAEIIFGHYLVNLFLNEAGGHAGEVKHLAQIFFWANGPFYAILAVLFVLRYALQGLGDTKTPTMAGIGEMLMRSLAAFTLVVWLGFFGASFSNPLAWMASVSFLVPAWLKFHKKIMRQIQNQDESQLKL